MQIVGFELQRLTNKISRKALVLWLTEKAKNGLPKLPYSLLINKCFLRWEGFDRSPVYEGIKTMKSKLGCCKSIV